MLIVSFSTVVAQNVLNRYRRGQASLTGIVGIVVLCPPHQRRLSGVTGS